MKSRFENLRELREQLVGMRLGFVAKWAGIGESRLEAIEQGELPTTVELESLSQLYGVDADVLEEEPIELLPGDAVACLARAPEFRDIGDSERMKIIAAANAARDLVALERMTGHDKPRWEQISREIPRIKPLKDPQAAPFRQGARIASQLRQELGLGVGPIPSMKTLVEEHFPSMTVLHARLGSRGPAGLAFVDRVRGPTIVLNVEGKNTNACVRRVSLAHELCHVLTDWNRREPLATISGYLEDATFEMEQRANAFAIRFLCPEPVAHQLAVDAEHTDRLDILGRFSEYGIPYAAIRLYLKNQLNRDILGEVPSSKDVARLGYGQWASAEEEADLDLFPLEDAPLERRTVVARTAAELYSRGDLTRAAFAAYLGVSPLCEVEQVLDFYGIDPPRESP